VALRGQLLTLLFLEAVGLRRTWDLRGYSGQALALLTGRDRAYGYRHTERFLAELASIGADASLTEALARWTASLWEKDAQGRVCPASVFYVDGHRKPVHADALIPRGLIGRTGKILGCRALVVLHDQEGHLLLATTHRGDQHLTIGLPAMLTRYEQAADLESLKRIVVDREGMSAEFLAALASEGRTVVTVLRTDQYIGVQSFREVGAFVPLQVDRQGQVIREVALARFDLPLPDHPGQELEMRVALIRDWRRLVPKAPSSEEEDRPLRWDEKPDGTREYWLDENWQATPLPAPPISRRFQHPSSSRYRLLLLLFMRSTLPLRVFPFPGSRRFTLLHRSSAQIFLPKRCSEPTLSCFFSSISWYSANVHLLTPCLGLLSRARLAPALRQRSLGLLFSGWWSHCHIPPLRECQAPWRQWLHETAALRRL
jgi:hypothetical protein